MRIVKLEEATSIPEFREYTPDEVRQALRLSREAFSASELQAFTELDQGIPFEQVLAELEEEAQGSP